MTQIIINQHNFNGGVLEPRMFSRVNTDAYAKGSAVLDNIVQLPQGGIKRRGGLQYIDEIPAEARLVPFSFSTTQNYMLAFYVDTVPKMNVYKDGVKVTNINGSGNDYLEITAATYTQAQLLAINWTQSADTLFIVHEDVAPISIIRGSSDSTWTQTLITLNNIPKFDFNDAFSPAPTSEVQDITFTGAAAGEQYKLSVEGITTEPITWSSDQDSNASRMQEAIRALGNVYPRADFSVSATSATRYVYTFADGAAKDWEPIEVIDIDGAITAAHNTLSETNGVPRSEDVWSSTRGWPKTVTLHEARLWFGGSKSRVQTVWGTAINEFTQDSFDFDGGLALDDDGIDVTLDTDQVNAITSIISGRHLQILTKGGEFAILKSPITPDNVAVIQQSRYGSSDVRPVAIDGATMFMQRTGRSLREYLFSDVENAYTASSLSLLASHLLNTPVDTDALIGTSDDDANYVYVVNTDGNVAVFNTLRDQEIAGWTRFTTDGKFKRVGVDDQSVYFIVERTINSATKYYLECLNESGYTDSFVTRTGGPTFTGLSHIEGKTVRVRIDSHVVADEVVSGGQITADETPVTSAEIGLDFKPVWTTLPLNSETSIGSTQARKTRVVRTSFHVQDTLGLTINGALIPDRKFGVDSTDTDPSPFTGTVEHRLFGWTTLPQLTISQNDPLPMTVLGAEYTIKVNH